MQTPLATVTGTGLVRELTKASSRQMQYSCEDQATLSFSMPGNHPETALITPLANDVLVYRDAECVQRFRVVSRKLTKSDGQLTAQFSCVSYRGLLNAWLVQADQQRSWPRPGHVPPDPASTEQTAIAWTILSEAQARGSGSWRMTKGPNPTSSQNRTLVGSVVDGSFTGALEEYLLEGTPISEVISGLAEVENGFDWDIVPDPAAPMTQLKFMTWTVGDGGRNQHAGLSEFILDDGGNVAGWDHDVTPSAYGNVMRLTGNVPTADNYTGATVDPVWVPTDKGTTTLGTLPAHWVEAPPEGRWERDVNRSDLTTEASVAAAAGAEYDKLNTYLPTISVNLTRGRWEGLAKLWLGDKARVIITEPVVDGEGWIVYVDEEARVVDIDVTVDDLGAEDVTLTLNRRAPSTSRDARNITDRLRDLERR